jgi:hypothetical protein
MIFLSNRKARTKKNERNSLETQEAGLVEWGRVTEAEKERTTGPENGE